MNFTDGMLKEGSLKGKNILITGGGTGLGRSMGEYFLELGANLVITSRKMDVLQQTADEMMVKKGGVLATHRVNSNFLKRKNNRIYVLINHCPSAIHFLILVHGEGYV